MGSRRTRPSSAASWRRSPAPGTSPCWKRSWQPTRSTTARSAWRQCSAGKARAARTFDSASSRRAASCGKRGRKPSAIERIRERTRLPDVPGVPSIDDPAVRERADAVVIATHHDLHPRLAVAAADAGKHVFVEKPLALTLEGCRKIGAAVARNGVQLMVGFQARHSPFVTVAREAIPRPRVLVGEMIDPLWPIGRWAQDPVTVARAGPSGTGRLASAGVGARRMRSRWARSRPGASPGGAPGGRGSRRGSRPPAWPARPAPAPRRRSRPGRVPRRGVAAKRRGTARRRRGAKASPRLEGWPGARGEGGVVVRGTTAGTVRRWGAGVKRFRVRPAPGVDATDHAWPLTRNPAWPCGRRGWRRPAVGRQDRGGGANAPRGASLEARTTRTTEGDVRAGATRWCSQSRRRWGRAPRAACRVCGGARAAGARAA